jgi:hypothetical protein
MFRKDETAPRQRPEHGKGLLPQPVFQHPQAFAQACAVCSPLSYNFLLADHSGADRTADHNEIIRI